MGPRALLFLVQPAKGGEALRSRAAPALRAKDVVSDSEMGDMYDSLLRRAAALNVETAASEPLPHRVEEAPPQGPDSVVDDNDEEVDFGAFFMQLGAGLDDDDDDDDDDDAVTSSSSFADSAEAGPCKTHTPPQQQLYFDGRKIRDLYYSKFMQASVKANGLPVAEKKVAPAKAATAPPQPPPPQQIPAREPLWRAVRDSKSSQQWRTLLTSSSTPLGLRELQDAKKSWFRVAERQHARAALLGSATLLAAPLDAERLWPLWKYARCGCPSAFDAFLSGVPNAMVELPLLLSIILFSLVEMERCLFVVDPGFRLAAARAVGQDDETPLEPSSLLLSNFELHQGRLGMLACALYVAFAPYVLEAFPVR